MWEGDFVFLYVRERGVGLPSTLLLLLGVACPGLACLHEEGEGEALAWLVLPCLGLPVVACTRKGKRRSWLGLVCLDLTWPVFLNLVYVRLV